MTIRPLTRHARAAALAILTAAACAAPSPAQTAGGELSATRLTPAARHAIADSVARILEARYADSTAAVQLAQRLRARVAAGAYDRYDEPAAFGAAMMADMQEVSPNKHLRLTYEPTREYSLTPAAQGGAAPAGAVRWNRIDGRDSATLARTNFAFDAVERLAGNVGYLKFRQFVPLDYSRETVVAAMAFLANSDAVIIDLRDNVGGSPELVELILSYFYGPEPVTLLTTYGRYARVATQRRTLREVPGRRMPEAELWVLINGNSASAAEMLPYAVQRLGRGVVVGETSAGAGIGGAKQSVGAGLALFVPQMQVISGPGYERTGVTPDVPVAGERALEVAHRVALEKLAGRDAPAEVREERRWALELVRARQSPVAVDTALLRRYAGSYGTRTFTVEEGRLVSTGALGWKSALVPVGGGVFRGEQERLRFESDADGAIRAVSVEVLNGASARRARQADTRTATRE
ncbi:MAG TPA: S41 family peptidase [Longimicrobium sp.]|nr:S41 family peptidase [Longimicrobium sp.]